MKLDLRVYSSSKTAGGILFAVAPIKTNAADDFVVNDDRKATNEDDELTLEAALNRTLSAGP